MAKRKKMVSTDHLQGNLFEWANNQVTPIHHALEKSLTETSTPIETSKTSLVNDIKVRIHDDCMDSVVSEDNLEANKSINDNSDLKLPSTYEEIAEKDSLTETSMPIEPSRASVVHDIEVRIHDDCRDRTISEDSLESNQSVNNNGDLRLPTTYEEISRYIVKGDLRLTELLVPVTRFEEQIIQVVTDIRTQGYLLFLLGVSGVGKSTFANSLNMQKHIPIEEVTLIDASEIENDEKLSKLLDKIKSLSSVFFSSHKVEENSRKPCIVIEYLENIDEEDAKRVKTFFRDLNAFLRKYPILIIWPVTNSSDLKNMKEQAKTFSSTMFHYKLPHIDFTGPDLDDYPKIAKKTIPFFNSGKSCYEFQITDHELEELKNVYEKKPQEMCLIRSYLQDVKSLWKDKSNTLEKIRASIPKPTEVWFIFSYKNAESVVGSFSKKIPDIPQEMWDATYQSLYAYITSSKRRQDDWSSQELTFALNSPILTTKIMYLPTNALISCIAAYSAEVGLGIRRRDEYHIPNAWFGKAAARKALVSTPLYLQLANKPITSGKRKSGKVAEGIDNAQEAFKKINRDISDKSDKSGKGSKSCSGQRSDQPFNRAFCLALADALKEDGLKDVEKIYAEGWHPYLETIKPDIVVEFPDKIVCIEMSYSTNDQPSYLADYVLRKLHRYMKRIKNQFALAIDGSAIIQ